MQIVKKQIFVVKFFSGGDLLVVNFSTFLVLSRFSFFFLAKVFPQSGAARILREFSVFAVGDNHVNAISWWFTETVHILSLLACQVGSLACSCFPYRAHFLLLFAAFPFVHLCRSDSFSLFRYVLHFGQFRLSFINLFVITNQWYLPIFLARIKNLDIIFRSILWLEFWNNAISKSLMSRSNKLFRMWQFIFISVILYGIFHIFHAKRSVDSFSLAISRHVISQFECITSCFTVH